MSEAVSTDLIPAQANKADGITDQDDNDDGDVDMEQHLGADLGLDLTQAELARRHQSAVALLEENGVDPQSLSERHMAVFANQREEQQRASLQLIVDHGAERLRVVDPPQPEGEDVFGSPPPMQPQCKSYSAPVWPSKPLRLAAPTSLPKSPWLYQRVGLIHDLPVTRDLTADSLIPSPRFSARSTKANTDPMPQHSAAPATIRSGAAEPGPPPGPELRRRSRGARRAHPPGEQPPAPGRRRRSGRQRSF